MGIDVAPFLPAPMPLKGLPGEIVQPVGMITLYVFVGSPPRTTLVMVDVLVMRASSLYNAIIGHPTLNKLEAITSTYHLKVKFPTAQGVGEIRGRQILMRECYMQELKPAAGRRTPDTNMLLSQTLDKLKSRCMLPRLKGPGRRAYGKNKE